MIQCESVQTNRKSLQTAVGFSLRSRFPQRYEQLFQAALPKGEPSIHAWESYSRNLSLSAFEKKILTGFRNKLILCRSRKCWNSFNGLDYWLSTESRFAIIQSPQVGIFRIDFRERKIDWKAAEKISSERLQAILRARIVGFAISHFPKLLLHASVVVRGIRIVNLEGKKALTSVLRNLYNPIIKDPKILRKQFKMTSQLVRHVSVKELIYPSGFGYLPKVYEAVLRDLSY